MRTARWVFGVLLVVAAVPLLAQIPGDQLGIHDMTPGGNQGHPAVSGAISSACMYCHAPHSALPSPAPLWNQQLSVQTYTTYTSTTYHQTGLQPQLGNPSKLCLSCHDGTIAPGQTVAYGPVMTSGSMKSTAKFGANLISSHPFSMRTPLVESPEMNARLFGAPPRTADSAVRLINGSVECTTCHEPHFQGIDRVVTTFLVRDSSNSQLCLACHDPNRTVIGQTNYLAGWSVSAHAVATNTTPNQPYVGGYSTVAQNGCNSCHMPHNAAGPARLLRSPDEQDCISCHQGTNTSPAAPNVLSQFQKTGHPFASPNNSHDRAESTILENNRHATCVDCHNPHASQVVATFGSLPPIRASQASVAGVSATDGITVVSPALNQYENCFRCHGTSQGKGKTTVNFGYQALRVVSGLDPLNIISQFAAASTSSHPVTHDRTSVLPQPSLRPQMLKLDGVTPGRDMGTRIFCTDCHNSDDNREFGGNGPNGPHGSKWTHILERRYEMSQTAAPGGHITNSFPNPDVSVSGPYALCAKCHDLSQVMSGSGFRHQLHVGEIGASCSVCHTAHGMGAQSPNISGDRLVNFDANVVAPNGATPIFYNRTSRTCTLVCHGESHH